MRIATHLMEPWLLEHHGVPYNLAQSGVADRTLSELLRGDPAVFERLADVRLSDNDPRGSLGLRTAIATLYEGVTPETVLVTAGTSEALFLYFHVRFQPGANVVVPVPAFQSLYEVPRYLGYEVRLLPLDIRRRFRLDVDRLASLVDRRTRAIVINTPHNPTGLVFTERELDAVRSIAESCGADILADEHYRLLPYGATDLLPSLYSSSPSVVATGSMIKCLGCVGLRVGWIIGDRALLAACQELKDYTTHTISPLIDLIAADLLQQWRPIAATYRRWIAANLAELRNVILRNSDVLEWIEPEAGVVSFPHFKDRTTDTRRFARMLIERHGVFVMPGEAFEQTGYFRISCGVRPDVFREAMNKLSTFIATRGWQSLEQPAC